MSTVYSFTQKDAYTSKGNIKMPKLENIKYSYDVVEGNATISLHSIKMSASGTVYAIAREFIKIVPDPENEFGTKDIQTRIPETPSPRQIYACKDWNDEPADSCARVVIANNNEVQLLLKDLKPNAVYAVYYTVANEYPIEPILGKDVGTVEVRVLGGFRMLASALLLVIISLLYVI